jgi:hypothetical protein
MPLSTNQYKLYVTFSSIITYALILLHLIPRRNASITIASPPSPSPLLPPFKAHHRRSSTQQQNVQQFYSNAISRRHGHWPLQWPSAPQHCKHPHHGQKHLAPTKFYQHSIGWLQAKGGITIPIPPQIRQTMQEDQVRQPSSSPHIHLPKCRPHMPKCMADEAPQCAPSSQLQRPLEGHHEPPLSPQQPQSNKAALWVGNNGFSWSK